MSAIKLWKHQIECVEKLKKRPNGALFMEPGTGKTATTIHLMRCKYNEKKELSPTLIFCPPIVVKNWKREILAHSKIPTDKILPLIGSGANRLKDFLAWKDKHKGNFIAITNYEAVQMAQLFAEFIKWKPKILVSDECHRLKNSTALRTKKVMELSDLAEIKYILTGTPVLNTPMDLFSQYRIMDGGQTFGRNYFAFRYTYFYDKNVGMPKQKYFPNWVPKPACHEQLGHMIEASSFQAKKSECLTLPPLVCQRIEVELSAEQKKSYKEMLKTFVTIVKEEACVAQLAITKSLRLQQIIAGFVRTDTQRDVSFDGNPRLAALGDLLQDITPGAKCIVWCNFRANYAQIEAMLKGLAIPYVFLTGEQSTKDKDEAVHRFSTDEAIRVMVGNPQAGGEGVNLVSASHMIYYTRNFSLKDDIQSAARNYRGGSECHEKITRWDIVAPGTIDEVILSALENKQDMAKAILDYAKGTKL